MAGSFKMNPNFERNLARQIQNSPEVQRMAAKAGADLANRTFDDVAREYGGQPVEVVRPALEQAVARSNEGASITEPILSTCAEAISKRRRVWVEDDGRIMVE